MCPCVRAGVRCLAVCPQLPPSRPQCVVCVPPLCVWVATFWVGWFRFPTLLREKIKNKTVIKKKRRIPLFLIYSCSDNNLDISVVLEQIYDLNDNGFTSSFQSTIQYNTILCSTTARRTTHNERLMLSIRVVIVTSVYRCDCTTVMSDLEIRLRSFLPLE